MLGKGCKDVREDAILETTMTQNKMGDEFASIAIKDSRYSC